MFDDKTIVEFWYLNYKGVSSLRRVRPIRIWFGCTAWHREAQWLLEAFDVEKLATRDFAMSGIISWREAQ